MPMRGLLNLILRWRGISFEEDHSKGRGYDSMLKILKIEKRIHFCTVTFRRGGRKLGLTFLIGPQTENLGQQNWKPRRKM